MTRHLERPVAVYVGEPNVANEERVSDHALAILKACLPAGCLETLAFSLEALRKEHADGGLDVRLNTHEGKVYSADVSRRVHWSNKTMTKRQGLR